MLEVRNAYEILIGNPERKRLLRSPKCIWIGLILKCTLCRLNVGVWTEFRWRKIGSNGGFLTNIVKTIQYP
jgi:hypothetical protein